MEGDPGSIPGCREMDSNRFPTARHFIMDQNRRLKVFQAQTENLREIDRARKQLIRIINLSIRVGDENQIHVYTRLLALLRSAWAETLFSKIIHTPHGFRLEEIRQIKEHYSSYGVGAGWKKCLELGLAMLRHSPSSKFVPNAQQKLSRLVEQFIIQPSLLRNKIAHGQWVVALNRKNEAINQELTDEIASLDPVEVDVTFSIIQRIAETIEDMIESPQKAFQRDYWVRLAELEAFIERTKNWNIASKKNQLMKKPPVTP